MDDPLFEAPCSRAGHVAHGGMCVQCVFVIPVITMWSIWRRFSPPTPARMCLRTMRFLRVSKHTLRQGSHLEKLTFSRRLTLRNLLALAWLWALRLLKVSKHTIRQGLYIEKPTFLGSDLGAYVMYGCRSPCTFRVDSIFGGPIIRQLLGVIGIWEF